MKKPPEIVRLLAHHLNLALLPLNHTFVNVSLSYNRDIICVSRHTSGASVRVVAAWRDVELRGTTTGNLTPYDLWTVVDLAPPAGTLLCESYHLFPALTFFCNHIRSRHSHFFPDKTSLD